MLLYNSCQKVSNIFPKADDVCPLIQLPSMSLNVILGDPEFNNTHL